MSWSWTYREGVVTETWSWHWSAFHYGPLVVWKRIYAPLFR